MALPVPPPPRQGQVVADSYGSTTANSSRETLNMANREAVTCQKQPARAFRKPNLTVIEPVGAVFTKIGIRKRE